MVGETDMPKLLSDKELFDAKARAFFKEPLVAAGNERRADIALRQWAFERAQQIIGTTALTEDVIESADAILAWVTKRGAAHG